MKAALKKTIHYFKKNGIKNTCYAIAERLFTEQIPVYTYVPPAESELERQRQETKSATTKISILVPAYCTKEEYLRALIESCLAQTYGHFELILADASPDNSVKKTVDSYHDSRIIYRKLESNGGISENTNAALEFVTGDYTALLDHDDLLTPDALYEMWHAYREVEKQGIEPQLLYSDEDKCDETGDKTYEPHIKEKFNLDLLLSNNYICHFLMMKTDLIRSLRFRKEYDGAQDYDLVLRAVAAIPKEEQILHIGKVLYHWRCHSGSTAENPQSKMYAYEAGKRALEDFLDEKNWKAKVFHTEHLGFYRVQYEPDILTVRKDVAIVGGRLLDRHNKITGGMIRLDDRNRNGIIAYEGLHDHFSGYMHRAVLLQDAEAVDIRMYRIRPELKSRLENWMKEYSDNDTTITSCKNSTVAVTDLQAAFNAFCVQLRAEGYHIVWDPSWVKRNRN
ncbi:MAG: glycosyltransferase [Lachnospiraceae bacterium]|nr:glycosyltransferase [Lachnospiraceae bacterium]